MPSRPSLRLQPGKQAREHIAEAQDNYRRYERLLQTPEDTGWALVQSLLLHRCCYAPCSNKRQSIVSVIALLQWMFTNRST